ncbi:MAG: hypothetical protein IPH11_12525 [Ignavibacteriales bacterium]|nr:hypothetical protein [Ignavibacteriales bacterium]
MHPSNNTFLKDYKIFHLRNTPTRNFHFGIREHGMAGVMNGMAIYGR